MTSRAIYQAKQMQVSVYGSVVSISLSAKTYFGIAASAASNAGNALAVASRMFGAVSGTAQSASGSLRNLTNALNGIGNISIPRVTYNNVVIDGSHSSGLGYVPFDGYIAELHKGEMVVPSSYAEILRGMSTNAANTSTFGLPASASAPAPVPVPAAPVNGGRDQTAAELRAIREEIKESRRAMVEAQNRSSSTIAAVGQSTERQTSELQEMRRENNLANNKLSKALVA